MLDQVGRHLADREFPTTPAGYRALLALAAAHGGPAGAGRGGGHRRLRRRPDPASAGADVTVVEVDRPDRKARRAKGKSDPIDAYAAARAALSGTASGSPKRRDGRVEAIRALRVARRSAVKARTQAINQLRALLVTGPAELREQLRHLSATELIATCARLRPTGTTWPTPSRPSRPRCGGWPAATST